MGKNENSDEMYEWQKTLKEKNPDYEVGNMAVVTGQGGDGPVETEQVNVAGTEGLVGDKSEQVLRDTDGQYTVTGETKSTPEETHKSVNVTTSDGEVVKEDVDVSGDKTIEVTEPDPQTDDPKQTDAQNSKGTNFRVTTKDEPADDQKRQRDQGRSISLPRPPRRPQSSGLGLDVDPTTAILAVGGALVAVIALMRGDD